MERKLYSSRESCSSSCKYCFSNFKQFSKQEYISTEKIYKEFDVIYPSCDSEIVIDNHTIEYINKSKIFKHNTIISFSTKGIIKEEVLKNIRKINSELIPQGYGFIKVSISITNKSRINELEPKSANYIDRIETLRLLKEYNIPSSLILKPILPFIDNEEYFEIIDDVKEFEDNCLLGGLYIDVEDSFYKNYIKNKFPIVRKKVNWLNENPIWFYVEDIEKMRVIENYLKQNNLNYYHNDLELISRLEKNIVEHIYQFV